MRFATRLKVCFAATVVFVLYFNWTRPSAYIQDNIERVLKWHTHRVVVFGDDWSDTGVYRVAPPPKGTTRDRDPHQGKLWTEILCQELKCDTVENYARSVPAQPQANDTIGSMVNADIFANATNKAKDELSVLFDFKAQVQQFINHEKNRKQLPAGLRQSDQWTVITILFGIWDLLAFSSLETMQAVETIDRSVAELMRNLDILVDHVEGPLKVVVPSVLDVTFLPRFFKRKNESSAMYAMDHHQAVFMWNHWNTALSKALVNWDRGDLSMPDLHGIVMDQVRNHQLYYNQISDADGFGTQAPLFHDVEQPCQMLNTSHTSDLQAAVVETCADPTRHLFWDDLHLSGPAHGLIGTEAARLVRGNVSINSAARQRAVEQEAAIAAHRAERQPGAGLGVKSPAGT